MENAADLIEKLNAAPCHFAGLSMGGFVGMRLAYRKPDILKSLILIETSADPEPKDSKSRYRLLILIARFFGVGIVMDKIMPIMFGQTFLNDETRASESKMWRDKIAGGNRTGLARAARGAVDRLGIIDDIRKIKLPTLILIGEEDVGTTPDKSERMHKAISGSQLVSIPKAGHSSSIEQPRFVAKEISRFLDGICE